MTEHYCEFHQTDFFKTDKMRTYAHPIKDKDGKTVGWCNEDAKEVAKLEQQSKPDVPPQPGEELPAPAPQAVGMMTKEIGDMMRADRLKAIFGPKITVELIKWYRSQALGITRIPFESKDLPEYKVD